MQFATPGGRGIVQHPAVFSLPKATPLTASISTHSAADVQADVQIVLSAVCRLHYGDDSILCYGCDKEPEDLRASQLSLLDEVRACINNRLPSTATLLFSGCSLAALKESCRAAGCSAFAAEDPAASRSAEPCEVFVLEGSIRYLDQIRLLTELRQRLRDNGRLILFGENLLDDSRIEYSELANLSSLLQLSKRLGFELLSQQDFSPGGLASLQLLTGMLGADRDRLTRELGWDSARMDAVLDELGLMAEEFKSGRRCFRLFEFAKLADSTGEFAPLYGGSDSFQPSEIKQLFEASFGVDFDEDLWNWKYQPGSDTSVVVREQAGGNIISHYGGVPRRIEYFGEPAMALQGCDIMVLPGKRLHYGKQSLFFKTAAVFFERQIGNTVRHLLGFGFPHRRVMKTAMRLGLYGKTDEFVEVVDLGSASTTTTGNTFIDVDTGNPEHRSSVNSLWQQMRVDFGVGIIGLRDSAYIDYRYFQHPFGKRGLYWHRFVLDSSQKIMALVVMKEHEQDCLLMDVVCPFGRIPAVLAVTAHLVAAIEGMPMKFWITRGWLERLKLDACAVKTLGIDIPCNIWNPGPSPQSLSGAWWLTAGDMDFI